MKPKNKIID